MVWSAVDRDRANWHVVFTVNDQQEVVCTPVEAPLVREATFHGVGIEPLVAEAGNFSVLQPSQIFFVDVVRCEGSQEQAFCGQLHKRAMIGTLVSVCLGLW